MLSQYQPLFLKYRPQALSELVGQQHVSITLTNAIKYNRISHAYLFTGPRGTGKTSAARIFAKSLNCELGPTAEPCQKCTSCIEIKQGISPSVFEIDAASNNSVDDARLLIERAPLSACGGRYKLYIIDECHMLTKEAFNALLKTIEEPPANVIFILATTEEHKVLPTIISRCQKLIFRLIDDRSIFEHLEATAAKENILIDREALTAVVKRANGGLRDALSLLDQISLLVSDGQAISTHDVLLLTGALPEDILRLICSHIFAREGKEVLGLLQDLFIDGREAHLIASELAKYMLNIAKVSYGQGQLIGSQSLSELAKIIDQAELVQMIEELDRLEIACRRSSQPIMNLEIGLLSLCQRLDIAQWQKIETRLQKVENAINLEHNHLPTIEKNVTDKQNIADKQKALDKEDVTDNKESIDSPSVNIARQTQAVSEEKLLSSQSEHLFDNATNLTEEEPLMAIKEAEKNETAKIRGKNSLDIAWQNILTELQRRHLPTFSLVSTHAFPIEMTENILTIGVFVENFQKMIENKVEYIKTAALSCDFSQELRIIVQVRADAQMVSAEKKKERNNSDIEKPPFNVQTMPINGSDQGLTITRAANLVPNGEREGREAAKEAYRLFEGPGSRYIAPSQ